MIQPSLFDTADAVKPKPPGERCKNCQHLYNHQYGKMKYCAKKVDRSTAYGHKKIKANDPACPMFEKIEK